MDDITVVYYTANQNNDIFEDNIRRELIKNSGGLQIISVSQKPIDLGTNICVGTNVGISGHNVFRQMQLGAIEAKTKYVIMAEADELYPEEYFKMKPEKEDLFTAYMPLWVLFAQRGKRRVFAPKPRGSESTMATGRDFIIQCIDKILQGRSIWSPNGEPGNQFPHLWLMGKHVYHYGIIPAVSVKTDTQLHRKTPHLSPYTKDIPYWGNADELLCRFGL